MSGSVLDKLVGEDLDAVTVIRRDVADELTAAGLRGTTYRGPNANVGGAIVVPGRPYVSWDSTREDPLAFGEARIGFDVIVLGRPDETAKAADDLDRYWGAAVQALDKRAARIGGSGVSTVSQPGLHTIGPAKFLAVVVTTTEHHRF